MPAEEEDGDARSVQFLLTEGQPVQQVFHGVSEQFLSAGGALRERTGTYGQRQQRPDTARYIQKMQRHSSDTASC